MQLYLVDVTGTNPVPPGQQVAVAAAGGAVVASGLTGPDGDFLAAGVQPGQSYVAGISGELVVPTASGGGSFVSVFRANADGSPTTVVFAGYDSPFRSVDGMAAEMAARRRDGRGVLPRGSLAPQGATTPVATCIAYGMSAPLAQVDDDLRTVLAAVRLGSCTTDALIEGFAADYLGTWGLRLPYETLPDFYARLLVMLGRRRCTIDAISAYVSAFLLSESTLPYETQALGEDTSGAEDTAGTEDQVTTVAAPGSVLNAGIADDTAGGEDVQGGEDVANPALSMPAVRVFDTRTDPATSALVPVANADGTNGIQPGQVCIFFVYQGYADTPIVTVPYAQPLQAYLENCVVQAGVEIVWCTNRPAATT